jgi:tRNA (cmo5U34)-methyltransferase
MDLVKNTEKNRDFFDGKKDGYDNVHKQFMPTKELLAKNLPSDAKKIVDLGVGTGLELTSILDKIPDAKIRGIDISSGMLEKLKEKNLSDNLELVCGDFFKEDYGINNDAVVSTSALHHFTKEDKLRLYKKIFESLKENGVFINSDKIVFNDEEEKDQLRKYEMFLDDEKYPHIDTPLTVEHEEEILKEAGFTDISVSETDIDEYRLFKAYKR